MVQARSHSLLVGFSRLSGSLALGAKRMDKSSLEVGLKPTGDNLLRLYHGLKSVSDKASAEADGGQTQNVA